MKRLKITVLIDAYSLEATGDEGYCEAFIEGIHAALDEYGYIREVEVQEE